MMGEPHSGTRTRARSRLSFDRPPGAMQFLAMGLGLAAPAKLHTPALNAAGLFDVHPQEGGGNAQGRDRARRSGGCEGPAGAVPVSPPFDVGAIHSPASSHIAGLVGAVRVRGLMVNARYEITYPIDGNRSLMVAALKAYRSRDRKGAVGAVISEQSLNAGDLLHPGACGRGCWRRRLRRGREGRRHCPGQCEDGVCDCHPFWGGAARGVCGGRGERKGDTAGPVGVKAWCR